MRVPCVFLLVCGLLAGSGREAAAQSARPDRPYRGLFGGRVDNPERLLTLTASIGSGYDSNVLLDTGAFSGGGTSDPRIGISSPYGSFAAGLNFTLHRSRFSIESAGSTLMRYYSDLNDPFVPAHSGHVMVALTPKPGTRVIAAQSIVFQPFLSLFVLPRLYDEAAATPLTADFGAGASDSLSLVSNVELSQRLSRRATLIVGYVRQRTTFERTSLFGDLSSDVGIARLSYLLARGLSARAGYGYQSARYAGTPNGNFRGHTGDIGVDFNRALSLSRRTTLTFATGSTANVYQNVTYYRLLGNARLVREFGRSWSAAAGYDRTVEFQPAYSRPVLGDAGIIGVTGLVSRRVQVAANIGAFYGQVGFSGPNSRYETYSGTTSVTVALSRNLGVSAGYAYYRYRFDNAALPLPLADLPLKSERQSIQTNLVLWLPLSYRARPTDATR
jgi:hypothetical protein